MLKRYEEAQEDVEVQTGILAATIANYTANWSMNPPKQGLQMKPADFMPSLLGERAAKRRRRKRSLAEVNQFNVSARNFFNSLKTQGKVVMAEKKD